MQEAVLWVFANAAVFYENRKCRIFTRSICSKENLKCINILIKKYYIFNL